ncbi:MAG: peptidase [Chlorobi bacterium]|nr:peptidase [Chlorobiota bacterium]
MKNVTIHFLLPIIVFLSFCCNGQTQSVFERYFRSQTLRIDYQLAGDISHTDVYFQQMKMVDGWPGSRVNLLDTFQYGTFKAVVRDAASGREIYSRGFSTLYQEWLTTAEAKKRQRSFPGVTCVPFPKGKVVFELYQRNRMLQYQKIFTLPVDPEDYFILKETVIPGQTDTLHYSGDPAVHLDIAILAEGYTREEIPLFFSDAHRLGDTLLHTPPYDRYGNKINIFAIGTASEERGPDIPGEGIYRNTLFSSTFYTFDLARYLTISDLPAVYDHLAGSPADQVIILVNSERYGGGGIFNYITVCSARNVLSPQVLVHEFGHAFAGLGDEYYNTSVVYENFYNREVEPWEPNLTTLVHFETKWKDMIAPDTPIPTPDIPENYNKVGVYEGGGYVAEGVYRPYHDCLMKSNETRDFCPVCQRAITRMIMFYAR